MTRYLLTIALLVLSVGIPVGLSLNPGTESSVTLSSNDDDKSENTENEESNSEDSTETEEETASTHHFPDATDHWAEDDINNLYESGVIHGYENGDFGPDDPVTRAQFLKIILKAFHYAVPDDDYASYAYEIGVIGNLDLWKNHPDDHVNRAEALKVVLEAGNLTVGDTLTPNFNDVDTVNDWFAPYTAFAKAQGISTGDSDGNFNAGNEVSRAEVCALTVRVMERQPSEE